MCQTHFLNTGQMKYYMLRESRRIKFPAHFLTFPECVLQLANMHHICNIKYTQMEVDITSL